MINSESLQFNLIKFAKKYNSKIHRSGQNINTSAYCYMPAFGLSQGHFKIRPQSVRNFFFSLIYFAKDLILISTLSNFKVKKLNQFYKKKYENLIVSWAKKKDFSKSGVYFDRYLGLNSKNKNTIWFLLYSDSKIPRNLEKNIILIYREKKFINIFFLFKYIFSTIKKNIFNLKNILHKLSSFTCHAFIVNNFFLNVLKNAEFKKILFPFESQPFQNLIISSTKKYNKKIKLIAYEHSIDAFPINNLYKKLPLDIFYVHSKAQEFFYAKYFGWPKSKIKHITSKRFFKRKKSSFENIIFLPLDISQKNFFLEKLDFYLNSNTCKNLTKLNIKIHPAMENSARHITFKKEIVDLLNQHNNKFLSKKGTKLTICMGATSSVVEILEHNLKVIHIIRNPTFDACSKLLWPKIIRKKISENIFEYFLKKNGSCVTLRKEKKI